VEAGDVIADADAFRLAEVMLDAGFMIELSTTMGLRLGSCVASPPPAPSRVDGWNGIQIAAARAQGGAVPPD